MLEKLTEKEREKVLRFRFEADRIRSAAGICMIKGAAAKAFPGEDLTISVTEHGKPYIADHTGYEFNLSHSGRLIVLATDSNPAGIDVEQIETKDWRIFHRYLTGSEMTMIENSSDPCARFFEVWTIREAFAKEEGLGLAMLDRDFTVDYESCRIFYEGKVLRFSSIGYKASEERYMITICSPEPTENARYHILSPDEGITFLDF